MKVETAGLKIRPWGLRKSLAGLENMSEDVVFLVRRAAYVDEIRAVALRERKIGLATLTAGLLLLAWAMLRGPGVHSTAAHYAEAAIAMGWALFVYVMVKRTRYVRRHPFDPND
jgi:hypothetical protein